MTSIYDFSARSLDGKEIPLSQFAGQVLLIVNVASECGFTGHYSGLQSLYTQFHEHGFSVLGFPCNQFGGQEPGDAGQIRQFCNDRYAVTFPMFEKIDVNGRNALPLYDWLKAQKRGIVGSARIKWNFTKFLIGRDGQVLARYGSTTRPDALLKPIKAALGTD